MQIVITFVLELKNKEMIKNYLFIAIAFVAAISFSSCDKDDPVIENEEELITTLNYTLTPTDGGAAIVLTFQDLDGDGDMAPMVSSGILAAGKTYNGVLELLNEAESPSENITEEIEEEDEDHQFFFQTDIAGLVVAYDDTDADGNPVGLKTTVTTDAAASGSLTITLLHEPVKAADGVSDGELANAGGEVDIEVVFPIDVQ